MDNRKNIDLLVSEFWKKGYLTLSRKYGTYLPEPASIGIYSVDIIAKQKNNYAIGITVTDEDFSNSELREKIKFLSTRRTKNGRGKVQLFVGTNKLNYSRLKLIIEKIEPNTRKNIKIFLIDDQPSVSVKKKDKIFIS